MSVLLNGITGPWVPLASSGSTGSKNHGTPTPVKPTEKHWVRTRNIAFFGTFCQRAGRNWRGPLAGCLLCIWTGIKTSYKIREPGRENMERIVIPETHECGTGGGSRVQEDTDWGHAGSRCLLHEKRKHSYLTPTLVQQIQLIREQKAPCSYFVHLHSLIYMKTLLPKKGTFWRPGGWKFTMSFWGDITPNTKSLPFFPLNNDLNEKSRVF